jgi:hypothetical protein
VGDFTLGIHTRIVAACACRRFLLIRTGLYIFFYVAFFAKREKKVLPKQAIRIFAGGFGFPPDIQ